MGIRSWLRLWVRALSQSRLARLFGITPWIQAKDSWDNTRRTRCTWDTVIRKRDRFFPTISAFGHCNIEHFSHSFSSGSSLVAEGEDDSREFSVSGRCGTTAAHFGEEYLHAVRIKKRKGPREL